MRKQFLIIITGLLFIIPSAFAQQKDHPLIGHLEGANLWYQNIYNINEYTVITSALVSDSLVSSVKITGKTTMTSYKYEGDNSASGIIYNYTDFLKNNGFEILLSCKSGECGGDIAKYFLKYNLVEIGDNVHAWQSRYFKNYLSAKKIENGKTIYVCIYIAQGWWNFPVYRIDVIEEPEKTNVIINDNKKTVNSNNNLTPNNTQQTNTKTDNINDNTKPLFSLQVGYTHYKFTSPLLFGGQYFTHNNGVNGGSVSGFSELSGIYVQLSYFINQNLSINASYGSHGGENSAGFENDNSASYYNNNAEISYTRLGITGGIMGKKYPVRLSLSTGAGLANIKAGFFEESYFGSTNNKSYYEGKCDFVMIYFQTEVVFPIVKGIYIFSEYEYNIGINGDLTMSDNSGGIHKEIKYENPGFGGNVLKIGIGYKLSKNN